MSPKKILGFLQGLRISIEKWERQRLTGLRHLGVRAHFRPRNDIEIQGRKISGTGGTELSGAILFQGTVLVDFDVDEMLRALRIPTEKLQDKEIESVKERVTCFEMGIGPIPHSDADQKLFDQRVWRSLWGNLPSPSP